MFLIFFFLDHLLHLYGPSVIAKQQLAKQNSLDLDIKSGFDNTAFLSEVNRQSVQLLNDGKMSE